MILPVICFCFRQLFNWMVSERARLLLILVLLIIAIFFGWLNKAVRSEIKSFFEPLYFRSKRFFIYFLILVTVIFVMFVSSVLRLDQFEKNDVYTYIGIAFTAFFGVIIALKTSTNNIGKLLSRISSMMEGASTDNELFIVWPTPFLGYLQYRSVFNKIDDYLNSATTYHLAFLDWSSLDEVLRIRNKLVDVYNEKYDAFKKVKSDLNGLTYRKMERKAKRRSWKNFESEVLAEDNPFILPDLFRFHFDEIQQEKRIKDQEKYDYFVAVCDFINRLIERSNNNSGIELKKIVVKYDYFETLFPIVLINNSSKNKVLHGTTRVESQFRIRFEGDAITDSALCNNAQKMFDAYCK